MTRQITAVGPERIWKWGRDTRPVQSTGKKIFCRAPSLFWLYKYN